MEVASITIAQALLLGFFWWFKTNYYGQTFTCFISNSCLTAALFVGIVLGDIPNAMIIGASVQLIYLGILGAQILSLIRLINTTWVHMADKYAEKGNTRGIYLAGLLYPSLARIPITVTPVAVAVYFGAAHIDKILAVIPEWLMNGLTVAGGMLPALGFAIVIKIIGKKELLPYFVAGYFILKLSGIGILPLSIFGVIAAYLHIMFTNKNSGEVIANGTAN